jgi:hypothetical protein
MLATGTIEVLSVGKWVFVGKEAQVKLKNAKVGSTDEIAKEFENE